VKKRRLFFGLTIPAETAVWVDGVGQRLRAHGVRADRWSPRALYHITVRFLGETPEERLDALAQCAAEVAAAVPAFRLQLGDVGAFRRSQVLWIGLREDAGFQRLVELYQKLEAGLVEQGLAAAEGRPYRPHLTLARQLRFADFERLAAAVRRTPEDAPGIPVSHLTLFESVRVNGVLSYPVLRQFPLGSGAAE
jgi:2'-5' RNA ligase